MGSAIKVSTDLFELYSGNNKSRTLNVLDIDVDVDVDLLLGFKKDILGGL